MTLITPTIISTQTLIFAVGGTINLHFNVTDFTVVMISTILITKFIKLFTVIAS